MGWFSDIFRNPVRAVTAVATGGLSEVARAGGSILDIRPDIIDPRLMLLPILGMKDNVPASDSGLDAPPNTKAAADKAELEAQRARERRRRLYAGMGRSSTILTGPSGLDMSDAANRLYGSGNQGKTLLGM